MASNAPFLRLVSPDSPDQPPASVDLEIEGVAYRLAVLPLASYLAGRPAGGSTDWIRVGDFAIGLDRHAERPTLSLLAHSPQLAG